jgi:tetratricopeptide (TPR) repeat protein
LIVPPHLKAPITRAILSLSDAGCHRLRCWSLLDGSELLRNFNWLRVQFAISGKAFLYHLYLAIAEADHTSDHAARRTALAKIQAARLAPHAAIRNGFERAIEHYNHALGKGHLDADEQLDATQQLANVHAVRRSPEDLRVAEDLYSCVLSADLGPHPSRRRLQAVIRSYNGLALVRFRQGVADEALAAEQAALDLAHRSQNTHPDILGWAERLVSYNVATLKLLHNRDVVGALEAMESIADRDDIAVDMASLKMRNHEYEDALDILRQRYCGRLDRLDLFEEKDVFGMVSLALMEATQGNRAEARNLIRAAAVPIKLFGSDEVITLAGRLEQLVDAD